MLNLRLYSWIILILASAILLMASIFKYAPLDLTETLGFITGAVCVLMVVEQNIWNFPVGIANNIFFIMLFFSSRLYGDMALQLVYILLAIMGWYEWIYGGRNRTRLHVSHTSVKEIAILAIIGIAATAALHEYFHRINDSAPFLDALTTVLSLIAQYMLNLKRIENWYIWITADVLYIWLYIQKNLNLTAILYAIFICMCIAGLISWFKSLKQQEAEKVAS
ncbi:MAG TPA: nicotinamide riboside transporter PnuC [Lentisphaeria bacterium]|nr:MAG: hypothetical protein A2X45_05760 [Lentisphaerae bacterium GWF2_50_93]HCE44766.1 nicotinamide riboside transporter PnuC [Lentisphaeria bacterium]